MQRPSFDLRTRIASPWTAIALLWLSGTTLACSETSDPVPREQAASQAAADGGRADGGRAGASADEGQDAATCEPPDGPNPGACQLGLHLFQCTLRDGSNCLGLDDGCSSNEGFSMDQCEDRCEADEFAAFCGGVGANVPPNTPPSPDCRSLGRNPGGGSTFYCCPCGGS
jgi:hypothetical protein